ncbi:MAG: hypothetical protein FJ290_25510 [Planctomycetes bacterium]|nr:hypothetical protein [Planctomycetota bacterium]
MRCKAARLTDAEWVKWSIESFARNRRKYVRLGEVLGDVLRQAAARLAPLAIVQTRAKSVASYAEKVQQKVRKYRLLDAQGKPLHPVTDLCGGRVITLTRPEMEAMCGFIEEHFDIDRANSLDKGKALKISEFGYRSVHYIVRIRPDAFPTRDVPVTLSGRDLRAVGNLWAEVQVRTVLEHAWASVSHDMCYKGAFKTPEKWERELARVAAILEDADDAFCRVQDGLAAYEASYGAYMTEAQIREKIKQLELVLRAAPGDAGVAHRLAKLAMCLGDWRKAVEVLQPFAAAASAPLLRDLGVSLCKRYAKGSARFRKGQKCLEEAIRLDPTDSDAIASLGGTWKGLDDARARALYQRAFEVNPADSYPLGNYLRYEIRDHKSLAPVSLAMPSIRAAAQRCRDQADLAVNLPWAFYDMASLHLLLKEPYQSLGLYAKAVSTSTAAGMVEGALNFLEQLTVIADEIPEIEWVRRFLRVAWAARCDAAAARRILRPLRPDTRRLISSPVAIIVGPTGGGKEACPPSFRELLLRAFRDFEGALLCGGTKAGVCGIVGDIGQAGRRKVRTIGYVPRAMPAGVAADGDRKRFRQIRRTDGRGFSPLEPLQMWANLLASGVPPAQVRVLGLGGGQISASEYRIAVALGATVGVLKGSGGAASDILSDRDWRSSPNLLELPADAATVRAFILPTRSPWPPALRERLAKAIHQAYCEAQAKTPRATPASLTDWDSLAEDLKESNRRQADDILSKLQHIGRTATERGKRRKQNRLSEAEVETLAELEHGRWNVERLLDGWRWAEAKDAARKLSPYLVSWIELPEEAKEWDRQAVRQLPALLSKAGLLLQ